jgi:hypothetical protein
VTAGYSWDQDAIDEFARGQQNALDVLREVGWDGDEASGDPLEDLALSADDLGAPDVVAATLADLLEQAHYEAGDRFKAGLAMVDLLRATGEAYQQVETDSAASFSRLTNGLGITVFGGGD